MQPPDSTWYPNTGATHHMTSSPSNLQNQQPYQGSHKFSLQNVFCLPSLRTDLHSGHSKDGLYPLSLSSHSSTVPRAFTIVHSPAWHCRLGHPSDPVLSHLAPSLGFKVSYAFCKDCALSKSTKPSFISNKTFAPSPFNLIHSDVWISPDTSYNISSNIRPPTLNSECLGIIVSLTLDHILKINSPTAHLNVFSLDTVLTTKVSSSSKYMDIEFRPILPSSTFGPVSITPAPDSDLQPHDISLVRTFLAIAVTTHDPSPAAPHTASNLLVLTALNPPITAAPNPQVLVALQSPAPVPRMCTRLQDGIQKPKLHTDDIIKYPFPRALLTVVEHTKPTCFSHATKHIELRDAMTEEINALLKNPRLVACQGINYAETFSPVVKPTTIRTILSLAVSRGGYFDIKDLGPLNYFLGLQVLHKNGTLHINQLKYAYDLLQKANLLNSKPASIPLATKVLLSVFDCALISNPTEYCELVGSLQYLTLTRPDISFVVSIVAQFVSAPRTSHLVAAKQILGYIKGTIDLNLTFTSQTTAVPNTLIRIWVPRFLSVDHWICDYSWN
ncbi:unnamed protein product [Prunus armeniaca]